MKHFLSYFSLSWPLSPFQASGFPVPAWSKPRMPKEGFGPEEVGGPITDIRASESRKT